MILLTVIGSLMFITLLTMVFIQQKQEQLQEQLKDTFERQLRIDQARAEADGVSKR